MRQLKNTEFLALAKWIEANLENLHGKKREDIAAAASATLGFLVTIGNIDGAVAATGVTLTPFKSVGNLKTDSVGKPYFLAKALEHLYKELGVPVPPYLHAISINKALREVQDLFNEYNRGQ